MGYNPVVIKHDKISPKIEDYSRNLGNTISNKDHYERFKGFLQSFDHHDEFYTESSLKDKTIIWSYGINKWLGHDDIVKEHNASWEIISNYVHPFVREWYKAYNAAAALVLTERETEYLRSRYVITFPMVNSQGEYKLIRQMSMPFWYDENGKIVSYVNAFSLFSDYRGEPLSVEFYKGNEKVDDSSYEDLKRLVVPCIDISSKENLTERYFHIIDAMRHIANSSEDIKLSNDNVAEVVSKLYPEDGTILGETVRKYVKDAKERLQDMFHLKKLKKYHPNDENKNYQKGLPKMKDGFELLKFADHSGIIDLLRAYLVYSKNDATFKQADPQ